MDELREIRKLLLEVMKKLERLENRIERLESESGLIEGYKSLLRAYVQILGSVAKVERLTQLVVDDIDKSIVRALATNGPMNISQITEEVRKQRGTASRRIVAKRLIHLERKGIVEKVDQGRGKVYRLKPRLSDLESL